MPSLFSGFERIDINYKSINGTSFPVAILVPKSLILKQVQKSCPLLVHFHGGGLFRGTNLDPAILSRWLLDLAEARGAIFVSPVYRLLPEATGSDIMDDLEDFWEWVGQSLSTYAAEKWPRLTVDLERTAVCGESAGGYLALQSAFLFPPAATRIKAVIAKYCAIYPDRETLRVPLPMKLAPEADKIIAEYTSRTAGSIRVSSPFPELAEIQQAVRQAGRLVEWMGDDERLKLNYCLRTAKNVPPIWVMQGIEDTIVPKKATDEMVAKIRKAHPETDFLYSVQPGNHGFDGNHSLNEPYIAEGVDFVSKYWP